MSIPRHDTIRGKLIHGGREYRVLNAPLPDTLIEHYQTLDARHKPEPSTAPWNQHQLTWTLKSDGLYLSEMYRSDLLPRLVGSDEIKADWVDRLDLHIATEKPLISGKALFEEEVRHMLFVWFEDGRWVENLKVQQEADGFWRNGVYIEAQDGIYTFRSDLIRYTDAGFTLESTHEDNNLIAEALNTLLPHPAHPHDPLGMLLETWQRERKRILYYLDRISFGAAHTIEARAEEIADQIVTVTDGAFDAFRIHLDRERLSPDCADAFRQSLEAKLHSRYQRFFDLSQSITYPPDPIPCPHAEARIAILLGYDVPVEIPMDPSQLPIANRSDYEG